jgi:hypothetical protein
MSSILSRNRISRIFIPRIFGSPIAFCGALLALASLAATAFALSSRAPNSLAISLTDYVSAICSQRHRQVNELGVRKQLNAGHADRA